MKAFLRQQAFTLVELMITVAIIGIIASIAYPAYDEQITKSKRADGMAALMSATQAMERYRGNNYNFSVPSCDISNVFASQVPVDGGTAYYSLSLACTSTSYTLTATPVGSMAGKKTLTITNTGARTWGADNCWPEAGSTCP